MIMSNLNKNRAEQLALALGGCRNGSGWMARCPAHDDRVPSLSICEGQDGRVLVHCFAGCRHQEILAALRAQGLWSGDDQPGPRLSRNKFLQDRIQEQHDGQKRTEIALSIWRSCRPVSGTLAEVYCRSRGITLDFPDSLRFHPVLDHSPSGTQMPALVAAVVGGVDGRFQGIHRTYLAADGSSKAPVSPNRMMLGPCRGGTARLAPQAGHLLVGEGLETCLAALQAAGIPAWAALSTSGLKALDLPREVREVTILADADEAGEAAAQSAAGRWVGQGRLVKIARPPYGLDFNDVLLGKTEYTVEVQND